MDELILVNSDTAYEAAATLFREYAAWLNIDLGFQHFEEELLELTQMYGSPTGGIILCRREDRFIACVAIRKITDEIAELKRMYVQPAYQQQGIGKALLDRAIVLALEFGYSRLRLDTLNYMTPAMNLYRKQGFVEIDAYYLNPNDTAVYFELRIKARENI